jgi:DNA polymerase-1
MIPVTDKAYRLLHEGTLALAEVESNGLRIDTNYLERAIKHTSNVIDGINEKLKKDKIYKKWKRTYRDRINLGSREQLGRVLFEVMKLDCPSVTKTGRYQCTESVLESIDIPFVQRFIRVEKLKKARSTYLKGILRETCDDGFLRPFFSLNLVRSYRSQSDHPNFQNIPIRNPVIAKLIRRAFIARKGYQLVEVDYGGAEICNAACYHHDPRMIKYIKNPKLDLHRDMAAICYMLKRKEVDKLVRYCGKNMFVFPQFYGDFYIHCARSMWEAIGRMKLKNKVTGESLKKHLRRKGITELGECDYEKEPEDGTFEDHIRDVEDDFWNDRFPVYNKWKKKWYEAYIDRGWFDTLTGFRIEGIYKRNDVINYPPQGSAFHWLLWSLIRIQKLLHKYNMRSLIVGQIHDSIVADVFRKELRNFLEICKQVMTVDIKKHWDWIIVPLTVEAEVAPVNGNWYEKKEVKL